jgi:uncharacterized membrane protein YbhN (UPF0104 family)
MPLAPSLNRLNTPRLKFLAKLLVTLVLFAAILSRVNWSDLGQALERLKPPFLVIVALQMLLNITLSARKWQILLAIHGQYQRLGSLVGIYLTGMFLSHFLPGNIGGDGYRIYRVYRHSQSKSAAVLPIFVERLTGIITLMVLGFIGALAGTLQAPNPVNRIGLMIGAAGCAGCLVALFFLFSEKPLQAVLAWPRLPRLARQALSKLQGYPRHPARLLQCFALSTVFYLGIFAGRWILLYATGYSCPLSALALVIMLSTLAATLPISLNGIGLLDGSFIYLIGAYGIPHEEAILVMVLYRAILLAVTFSGIFSYLRQREDVPPQPALLKEVKSLRTA